LNPYPEKNQDFKAFGNEGLLMLNLDSRSVRGEIGISPCLNRDKKTTPPQFGRGGFYIHS
jgi:hypothetical protein